MAEITWIKLKTDMFDNDKIKLIEALPEADTILIIWIKLLAAAGKANSNGYIMLTENIPMNIEEMATIFGRPLNTVRLAIQTFTRYGMIEIDENEVVRVANWDKHQNIDGMEHVKKLNAERQKRYREKQKQAQLNAPDDKKLQKDENEIPPNEPNNNSNVTNNVSVTLSNGTERDRDIDLERDIEKEREKERKKEGASPHASPSNISPIHNDFKIVQKFFEQKFRKRTIEDDKDLNKLYEFYPDGRLIIEAMKIALQKEKPFISYFQKILYNWSAEKAINTYQDFLQKGGQSNASNRGQSLSTTTDAEERLRRETERLKKFL